MSLNMKPYSYSQSVPLLYRSCLGPFPREVAFPAERASRRRMWDRLGFYRGSHAKIHNPMAGQLVSTSGADSKEFRMSLQQTEDPQEDEHVADSAAGKKEGRS